MKKFIPIVLFFATLLLNTRAQSQAFSLQNGDSVSQVVSGGLNKIYNKIVSLSSTDIFVNWKVTQHDFPSQWTNSSSSFGICDNVICYGAGVLAGTTQTTDTIAPGSTADFHAQIDLDAAPIGTHFMKVNFRTDAANSKDAKFIISKFPTNVTTITRSDDDVLIYPNPSRDVLNVVYDDNVGVRSISIHNIIGKQVDAFKVAGGSAKLDVSELPAGGYFLRLLDAQGRVMATRKFTHQ